MQVSTHSTYFILTTFTVRGQVLNMAGWKPSPVTTATGPDPDRLKLLKSPPLLQFLEKPRHTAGVFCRHLLREPPNKEGNLPELLLSYLRLSNLAFKSDGRVHLLLCWNRLKGALKGNLHWLHALIEEVRFIFWELLCNDHSVDCQFSSLGLWREGQKIPNAASGTFICAAMSCQICSVCYSSVHMPSVWCWELGYESWCWRPTMSMPHQELVCKLSSCALFISSMLAIYRTLRLRSLNFTICFHQRKCVTTIPSLPGICDLCPGDTVRWLCDDLFCSCKFPLLSALRKDLPVHG